jgi:RimJ/RimL family protein N-acetyltransferase
VDFRHVETPRLHLDAVVPDDLGEHFALMSDPGVWAHLPSGRHTEPARTLEGIRHSVGHWDRDGLGYWTARLREDLPGTELRAGAVVGTGGCALRIGTSWWNLYYRLTPAAWGLGLAAELVDAHSTQPAPSRPSGRCWPTCSNTTPGPGGAWSGPGSRSSGAVRTPATPIRTPCA